MWLHIIWQVHFAHLSRVCDISLMLFHLVVLGLDGDGVNCVCLTKFLVESTRLLQAGFDVGVPVLSVF